MPSTRRRVLKLSGGGKFNNAFIRSGSRLMHLFSTTYPRISMKQKLCTKVDYFLLGHKLSWATAHFVRCNGIKMQLKQSLHQWH